jgi:hypothetical protein
MKKLLLFNVMMLLVFLYSCEKAGNDNEVTPLLTMAYQNQIIEGSTDSEGKIIVTTTFPEKDITFDIQVVDTDGNPVNGIDVTYNQIDDKSVIFVRDPLRRYNSAFLYGPPIDLDKIAGHKDPDSPETTYQSKSVILTIGLLITVGAIAAAEVKIIKNAWVIQQFYISDAVLADKDYILYCKSFEEIAGMIKARTGIVLDATSIVISFATAGGSSAVEIANDILTESVEEIRDKLLNLAIDKWGLTMDQLVNRSVAVKVYPFDKDEKFANIKNLYALYEIDYNNSVCDNYINDVPYQVNNILTKELINQFEQNGMIIHKGFSPPDITGNYFMNDLTNLETGDLYKEYSYQFFNQEKDFSIELKYASNTSDAIGKGAFISGNDRNFSVYCEMEDNINDNGTLVYLKTINVYSGQMSTDGIINYQNGFIVVDKINDINNNFMNIGESRIVYEADGTAESVSDFPYSTKSVNSNNCKYLYIKK